MSPSVRLEISPDRVATIWFDLPDKTVNTLSAEAWSALARTLDEVERAAPVGVVFASAKPRSFIAGAELSEIQAMTDPQLDAHLAQGQHILDRIAAIGVPTVAAINGDALGGGFELALACRSRLAIDEPAIRIGLPETTLGLVPAWGGATRLPRLIGLSEALKLLVTGKTVSPAEALALGMVDEAVPRDGLMEAAQHRAAQHRAARRSAAGRLPADHAPRPAAAAAGREASDAEARRRIFVKCRDDVRARSGEKRKSCR